MSFFSGWGKKKEIQQSGYPGDLSPEQEKCFAQIKEFMEITCIDVNQIYDEYDILRFCRARDFKLMDVQIMLQNNFKWRAEKGVDDILDNFAEENQDPNFELALMRRNSGFHGVDKKGRPVYMERFCTDEIMHIFETLEHD